MSSWGGKLFAWLQDSTSGSELAEHFDTPRLRLHQRLWLGVQVGEPCEPGSVTQNHHVPASLEYMAPEVAKKTSRSSSSDMWSLGVIFLEMTTLLVGRTLDQLYGMVEKNSRGLEPYIWANPKVVNLWLDELRMSNIGPRHDNEPLAWVQDLLNKVPDSRPKSRALMLDILDCPSFSIFCCIRCQPEFRERHFEHADLQSVTGEAVEDSTDLMQNIAKIFEDDQTPTAAISSEKSASIQNWLAGSWVPQQMPGGFNVEGDMEDVESDDGISECEDQSESGTKDQVDSTLTEPQRPQGPWIRQMTASTLPKSGAEKFATPYNVALPLPRRPSLPREPLPNIQPVFEKDTGLGFVEIESPSSSDDEDMTGFRVIEDLSGSDSDSNDTINPFRVIEDETEEFDDCSPSKPWSLPKFAGEENEWVQTLDNLPEVDGTLAMPPSQDSEISQDRTQLVGRARLTDDAERYFTKSQLGKDDALVFNKTPSEIVPDGPGRSSTREDKPEATSAELPDETINNITTSSGSRIIDWRELPLAHIRPGVSKDDSTVPHTGKDIESEPSPQRHNKGETALSDPQKMQKPKSNRDKNHSIQVLVSKRLFKNLAVQNVHQLTQCPVQNSLSHLPYHPEDYCSLDPKPPQKTRPKRKRLQRLFSQRPKDHKKKHEKLVYPLPKTQSRIPCD